MIDGLVRDDKHVYRFKGGVVPGVTSVLGPLYEWLNEVPAQILERKGDIGRATHTACELIDKGFELDPDSIDPAVAPRVDAYRKFLREVQPEILANEEFIYHLVHRYAGQLDRIYRIKGVTCWVDLKTTSALSPAVGVQLAAYQQAYPSTLPPGSKRMALQLNDDGNYRLVEYNDPDDWPTFLSLLNLHRWRTKHA